MFKSEILVENGIELVKLWSIASDLSLKIAVNIGNTICSILKKNKEYLYFPYELKAYKNISQLAGIPFMHPWANRLEGDFIFIKTKNNNNKQQQQTKERQPLSWLQRQCRTLQPRVFNRY